MMRNIAFFISEHGFGHASRAVSIINKFLFFQNIQISVFSNIPKWFFDKSIFGKYELFQFQVDVGLVQLNPFVEDLEKTLENLDYFYSSQDQNIELICERIRSERIGLIICDISPLGIRVGQKLGIKTILIENFTWDWIYEPYLTKFPEFKKYIEVINNLNSLVDYHFQTAPICDRNPEFPFFPPIYRDKKHLKEHTRKKLGIPIESKLVLVTMGGIPISSDQFDYGVNDNLFHFVIPGSDVKTPIMKGNCMFLPYNHNFFHPDLVHASDVVIGKVGYSTIAEVYSAQIPFLYITRENFRESIFLEDFIRSEMVGLPIKLGSIKDGVIIEDLQNVLSITFEKKVIVNGADLITSFIFERV